MGKNVLTKYNNLYDQIYAKLNTAYKPESLSATKDALQQIMRPQYDQQVRDREQAAAQNRAAIDTDAAERGMLSSSYVTDVKNRQNDAAARDIANINSNYNSALMSALQSKRNQQEEMQFQANRDAQSNALALTNQLYSKYYKKSGGGGGGHHGGGSHGTTPPQTPQYDPLGSGSTTSMNAKPVANAMFWGEGQAKSAAGKRQLAMQNTAGAQRGRNAAISSSIAANQKYNAAVRAGNQRAAAEKAKAAAAAKKTNALYERKTGRVSK